MRSVAFVARIQFRRRLVSLGVIALVVGLIGGIAISLVAGSRRSASVVDRYYRASLHYDLTVYADPLTRAQIAAIPGVKRADPESYLGMVSRGSDGRVVGGVNGMAIDPTALDPTFQILRGRTLRPDEAPTNVLVNQEFVNEFGRDVGQDMPVQFFAEQDRGDMQAGHYDPHGPHFDFHIVGVVRVPPDVVIPETHSVGQTSAGSTNVMAVPASWYDANRTKFVDFGEAFDVQLNSPGDRDRVVQHATDEANAANTAATRNAKARGQTYVPLGPPQFGPPRFSQYRSSFQTPVDLETTIILVLGMAVAIAGAIAVALMLRAEQRSHSSEDPTLRALGATRNDVGLIAALRTLPVAGVGAALAVVVAYFLSSRFPIGVGRKLELDPGLQFNVAVVLLSALVLVVVVVATGFAFGRLQAARAPAPRHQRTLARWFAQSGAPADTVVAAHFAFDRGGGANSVPARSAIVGGAIALAVITGVGVFVTGIDDLYARPAAHGFTWDVAVGNTNFALAPATLAALQHDPRFAAVEVAQQGTATINGRQANVLAIDPKGTAPPVVLSGRLPATPKEIAVGGRALHDLHAHIGSIVNVSLAGSAFAGDDPKDVDVQVVGTVLAPTVGDGDLGEVSVVTLDGIRGAGGIVAPQIVFGTYRANDAAAESAALHEKYPSEMITDEIPPRAVSLHSLRVLPIAGLLLAGFLGTVLLVYVLAIAVRARTKEFGIVRALGMSARRLRRVLSWEGIIISAGMVLLGMPVGVFLGAVLWRVVANGLGISGTPSISAWTIALVPAVVLVGLAATVIPGRRLRGDDVSKLLRVE